MTLRNAIRKATKMALAAQGSIAVPVTYQRVGSTTVNTDTGQHTRNVLASYSIPEAFFTSYKEREIDGNNVQPADKRMTVDAKHITLDPALHDYVVDDQGVTWEVINFKIPPPRVILIFQVRRP